MAIDAKPVTVESSSTDILKSLTPAQMKTWRDTGNLPDLPKKGEPAKKAAVAKTETAESSPAAKETPEQAPAEKQEATETPAESVPAEKVEAPPKSTKPTSPAQARIKDLLAEVNTLRAENESLQKQLKPVEKSKAAAKPQRNDVDEKTGQPKYVSDEAYQDARDEWIRAETSRTTREEIAKEANDRQVAEIRANQERMLENRLKIAKEKHADFDTRLQVTEVTDKDGKKSKVFAAPAVKAIKTGGVVDAWILESDLGVEILYHLADKPEEIDRLQSLGAFAAARELTKLEQQLSQPAKSGSKPTEEIVEETVEAELAVKHVSSAPEPATSLSGKHTAPADKEQAALVDGDFRTYFTVANEKDWRKKKAS